MMRAAGLALVVCLAGPALAADPMGSAGAFRSVGWAHCSAPLDDWKRGACDPEPVDPSLPPATLVRAHIERAIVLVARTRLEEALKAANAAVSTDPQSVEALTFRGRVLATMMKPQLAERDYNAGLLLAPADPVLLASRAELLVAQGETQLALRDIAAAAAERPDDPDILWIKARIHMNLGKFETAERDLARAISRDPEDRRAWNLRAKVRLRVGNLAGAIEDTTALLASLPGDLSARETRAIALIGLGRHAGAIGDLEAILGPPGDQNPAHAMPHYRELLFQRAILFAQLGERVKSDTDIGMLLCLGGKQAVLRLQLYLRKQGFPDVQIDGERGSRLNEALHACLVNQACTRGINWPI